jgi:hypothetical protein
MIVKKLTKWLVVGTLVAAVVAAGAVSVGVVGVAAQTLGPGDGPGGFWRGLMGRWGNRESSFLADELGITVEELDAARQAAQEAALAQAIEEGDLTQEQVDLILAHQALRAYLDPRALMEEALDLQGEEGLDRETLRDWMQAARTEAVERALADGAITQAQADALLESEWGPMMGGGLRGRMQGGGFRGRGRGCPGMWNRGTSPQSESTPEG